MVKKAILASILIVIGGNVMADSKQILSDALNGNYDAIKETVKTRNDLLIYDEQGYSLFMLAVDSGNCKLVEYLINIGAKVNETLDDGTMAIHMAASADYVDILELLIQNGAKLNALAGPDASTPLQFAMEAESIDAHNALVRHGADANIPVSFELIDDKTKQDKENNQKEKNETSPFARLIGGAMNGDKEKILTAIENGADVNEDFMGHPPIIYAVQSENIEIIKLLLDNGAALTSLTGQKLWLFAKLNGHDHIAQYVKDKGITIGFSARLALFVVRFKNLFNIKT